MINDQQDKIEIPFDVEILILIDNSFSLLKHHPYAYGYRAYMYIWKPFIGDDSLSCKREDDNIYDENTVAVTHSNHIGPCVVGHIPFLYSSTFKKILFFTKSYNKGVGYWLERGLIVIQDMA